MQSEDVVVASAAKPAAPSAEWPQPTRLRSDNLVKQSGVPYIIWEKNLVAWKAQFPRLDSSGKKSGGRGRVFAVKKLVQQGLSEPRDPNQVLGKAAAEALRRCSSASSMACSAKRDLMAYVEDMSASQIWRCRPVRSLAELPSAPRSHTLAIPGVIWRQDEQQWRAQKGRGHCGLEEDKARERDGEGTGARAGAACEEGKPPIRHISSDVTIPDLGTMWRALDQTCVPRAGP